MKKIFVDAYINCNLGDDLFLSTLFKRYPESKFYINGNKKYKKMFKVYPNVEVKVNPLVKRAINAVLLVSSKVFKKDFSNLYLGKKINYKKYDGYVKIGGSIFIDTDGRHYQKNSKVINSFIDNKKSVFILGCNFEKTFKEELYKSYHRLFSNLNSELFDICFRDKYSYELFSDCKSVRYSPDILFGAEELSGNDDYIGFSLINLTNRSNLQAYQEKYENKMLDIINACINSDKRVALFSFCSKEGDLDVINNIVSKVEPSKRESIQVFNYDYNLKEFLKVFSSCKTIIATRFHAMILGLVYRKNIIPVIYSDKMLNVIKDIDFRGNYTFIKEIEKIKEDWLDNMNLDINLEQTIRNSEGHFKKLDTFLLEER